ncbi:MAG: methyltransferase [Sporichthyaceae bacterium]|jgi:protein-S-isoprenylcysteine O-methyltransferase Ste14
MSQPTVRQHAIADLFKTSLGRAAVLFLTAWTLDFPHAWAFLAVSFAADAATRLYLLRRDPDLLARRRLDESGAEVRGYQRFAQVGVNVVFLAMLATCALDRRNEWSAVPTAVSVVGLALVAAGLFVVFLALRANTFASVRVVLHEDQRVVSTGPYGHVRHPLYSGLILWILGTPLALGSWWGLAFVAAVAAIIAGRMVDEEKFLAKSLAGYREYTEQVRHRVVPLVW